MTDLCYFLWGLSRLRANDERFRFYRQGLVVESVNAVKGQRHTGCFSEWPSNYYRKNIPGFAGIPGFAMLDLRGASCQQQN